MSTVPSYSVPELERLQAHYAGLKDKASYDAFVSSAHDLLQRIGADPYHVRMAITRGKSLMEFGSRAAYRHSEGVGGIRVGLLMMEADIPQVPQSLNPSVHYFDPRGGTAIAKFTVPTWADIPADLLAVNEKAMRWEYERIKDTKLVEIRRGSGTDNEALRYAVVHGVSITALRATHYWVFQGNPRVYDTAGALRARAVRTWTVTAHTDKIRPGDKAIIWVTGQHAGCYALATIASAVSELHMNEADRPFVLDPVQMPDQKRVAITVEHDFSTKPVPWTELRAKPAMADFKGGSQGTTFTATKEQYDTILAMGAQTNERMNFPLNRIFYGPPGTGKTFHTINAAVDICDPDFYAANSGDREKIKARYEALRMKDWRSVQGPGRIGFCTFHQSFGYEDFVEGIKPMKPADGDSFLKYEVRPGILKQMVQRAEFYASGEAAKVKNQVNLSQDEIAKAEFFKMSLGDSQNSEEQMIYDYCIENSVVAIGFLGQYDLTGLTEQQIRDLPLAAGQSKYDHTAMSIFTHYLKPGNYVVVTFGNFVVRAIGRVTGDYFYDPKSEIGYPHFRKVEWLATNEAIPWVEIYARQFSQQTIYKLKKEDVNRDFFITEATPASSSAERQNFVLIIDEINRGNVAGIFGELITLIEENKRKGRSEALEVTLPYSQEPFSIPDNLFIIGTMNTADRSVEALDAALRRRFSFAPMMPEAEHIPKLKSGNLDLTALLAKLNERLVQLLDEDHQIGHSHFWELHEEADPIPALRRVFADKVIPQLEEYFHRDRSKLQLVLGERFVTGREPADDLFFGAADNDTHEPRTVYSVTAASTWDESAFRSLYEKV